MRLTSTSSSEEDNEEEAHGAAPARKEPPSSHAFEDFDIGDFVIIEYEGELFPGVIAIMKKDGAEVSAMQRSGLNWKWPKEKNQIFYVKKEIKRKIKCPKQASKRGAYIVPELKEICG